MSTTIALAEDLEWWADRAPHVAWRWAKTFADTAPHMYLMRGDGRITEEEYVRLFLMIQKYGQPAMFHGRVSIELAFPNLVVPFGPPYRETSAYQGFKFWPMSRFLSDSRAMNMSPMEFVYGEQTAPSTASHVRNIYDDLAPLYDEKYDTPYCHRENQKVWEIVVGDRYVPTLLDIGSGTGLALDLHMVTSNPSHRHYRAVDPSQAMMNQLIYKHPWVTDLHPRTFEDYLETPAARARFDTVISLFGSPSYIRPEAIERIPSLATKRVVLMHYREGYHPDYEDEPATAAASREAAAALPGAEVSWLNNFQVVTLCR